MPNFTPRIPCQIIRFKAKVPALPVNNLELAHTADDRTSKVIERVPNQGPPPYLLDVTRGIS